MRRILCGLGVALCAASLCVVVRDDTDDDEWHGSKIAIIQVTPTKPRLVVGGAQSLTATGTFSDGSKRDVTTQVRWTSSAMGVAVVSTEGEVVARGTGRAAIRGALGDVSATTTVTVSSQAPSSSAVR